MRFKLSSLLQPAADSIACRDAKKSRMFQYGMLFNLVWTVWVFGDLIFRNQIDHNWVLVTASSFPVFLLLYLLGYLKSQRHVVVYATAIAVLGYLVMPWNHSGGSCYLIYACAYMAYVGSTRQSVLAILAVVSGFALVASMQGWPWGITFSMAMVALSVGGGNLGYRLNARKDAELLLSHEEVRKLAALAERERIGRDLHDLLGHTLSLIALKSELARKLFGRDPVAARREIDDVERIAREALAQVRHAVSGIRAAALAGELASAHLMLECAGVRFSYSGFESESELPAAHEHCLALALREAVTNIQRHAGATRAEAGFSEDNGMLQLAVHDNGRGGIGAHGNGLDGMRERISALGGSMRIESARGQGTSLIVRLPLPLPTATAGSVVDNSGDTDQSLITMRAQA